MNIALSIDSFPVAAELAQEITHLLDGAPESFSVLLQKSAWIDPETRGFAVMAHTEEGNLVGVAFTMDISGLGLFEWTVFVHPEYRRLAIGSALADGIHHGLEQRGVEEALAVSEEGYASSAFFKHLGYKVEFGEVVYGAQAQAPFSFPAGFKWTEAEEGLWELRKENKLLAALFIEEEENLWISGIEAENEEAMELILQWSRSEAAARGKQRVLLDSDPEEEEDTALFERAGFSPVSSILYWEKP